MPAKPNARVLFLDVGGVLLTNGWDRHARRRAAEEFSLDYEEMDERHHQTFDTYEEGKISLDTYLQRVIFYRPREFTVHDFKEYLYSQSRPMEDVIDFMKKLARRHKLRVGAISNEGRELTEYRVQKFRLYELFDFFICSAFVHFRKPDEDMFRMALDVSQVEPRQSVYVDDRRMHVEVASAMGIPSVLHEGLEPTAAALAELGLAVS